ARGHAIPVRLGAIRSRDTGGIQQVFAAPRDAVQGAAVMAGGDFAVRLACLRQSKVAGESDDAAQLRIEARQPVEIYLRQTLGSEPAGFDPSRKPGYSGERDVGFVCRERISGGRRAYETICLGNGLG